MPCPTCNNDDVDCAGVSGAMEEPVYWCDQCGTLFDISDKQVPAVFEKAKDALSWANGHPTDTLTDDPWGDLAKITAKAKGE